MFINCKVLLILEAPSVHPASASRQGASPVASRRMNLSRRVWLLWELDTSFQQPPKQFFLVALFPVCLLASLFYFCLFYGLWIWGDRDSLSGTGRHVTCHSPQCSLSYLLPTEWPFLGHMMRNDSVFKDRWKKSFSFVFVNWKPDLRVFCLIFGWCSPWCFSLVFQVVVEGKWPGLTVILLSGCTKPWDSIQMSDFETRVLLFFDIDRIEWAHKF